MPTTLTSEHLAQTARQAVELAIALDARPETPVSRSTLLAALRWVGAHGLETTGLSEIGFDQIPQGGTGEHILRILPMTLLAPLDRPQLRRTAFRYARIGGADEGVGVIAIAAAMIAVDFLRFDLETTMLRVHQSLLEEAPSALLNQLSTAVESASPTRDGDALNVLSGALSLTVGRSVDGLLKDNDVFTKAPVTAMVALWFLVTQTAAREGISPLTDTTQLAPTITAALLPRLIVEPPVYARYAEGTN